MYDYYYLLRDALIYGYSQTDKGREYLNNCWRLEQTDIDSDTLKKMFGKEDNNGK